MNGRDARRLRYVHRGVGVFVLVALILALVGMLQSGRVERWFNPLQPMKVILPQEGLHGLSAGATVEVLGTDAGEVQAIVIEPDQQIHADVLVRRDMKPFIRQDSEAFIRKRFGVAGDSYLEITRGFGAELDWEYAVLEAQVDRGPTDMLQHTLTELREHALPLLQETRRAVNAYADLGEQLADPEGSMQRTLASLSDVAADLEAQRGLAGRVIGDEQLADHVQSLVANLNRRLAEVEPVLAELEAMTKNLRQFSGALNEQGERLPELSEKLTANLDELRAILGDLRKTTPRLPEVADQVADATAGMPALVTQAQSTLLELEKLAAQLRSSWLLGGQREAPPSPRLSPEEAAP